jgi:hypothetical protein
MTAALALPLPSDLTPGEKDVLLRLGVGKFIRRTGGWYSTASGTRLSLTLAEQLVEKHLVRVDRSGRFPELVLTGAGVALRAVVQQRREQRSAAREARP